MINHSNNENCQNGRKGVKTMTKSLNTPLSKCKTIAKCAISKISKIKKVPETDVKNIIHTVTLKKEIKSRLKKIWSDFIKEYPLYKEHLPIILTIETEVLSLEDSAEDNLDYMNFNCLFEVFLLKNDIEKIMNNTFSLKSLSVKGSKMLSYVEPWLMYIKYLIEEYTITSKKVDLLFSEAVKYSRYSLINDDKDKTFQIPIINILFMFYCIEMTGLEKREFDNNNRDEEHQIKKDYGFQNTWSQAFLKLWQEYNKDIRSCLYEENYKKLLTLSMNKNKSQAACINKQSKKKQLNTDESLSYLHHANIINDKEQKTDNFVVLELLEEAQKETGEKYILTPLKRKHNNQEVHTDIKIITKKYPNITYVPYNDEIVQSIHNNQRVSLKGMKK